jgi:hypothetical protein
MNSLYPSHTPANINFNTEEQKASLAIDPKYAYLLNAYRWRVTKLGYLAAVRFDNGKREDFYLHREIAKLEGLLRDKALIDHVDGNKLNNRLSNLRVCDRRKNRCNSKLNSDNTSGYKGVGWLPDRGKWQARIKHQGKTINLGYFTRIEDAIQARQSAEAKYQEEFSYAYSQELAAASGTPIAQEVG